MIACEQYWNLLSINRMWNFFPLLSLFLYYFFYMNSSVYSWRKEASGKLSIQYYQFIVPKCSEIFFIIIIFPPPSSACNSSVSIKSFFIPPEKIVKWIMDGAIKENFLKLKNKRKSYVILLLHMECLLHTY